MAAELTQHGTAHEPWGASRLGHYTETAPVPAFTAVLDPETQIPVLVDDNGRTVKMGKHGSSTSSSSSTSTSGDGAQPGSGGDSDSVQSNDQD